MSDNRSSRSDALESPVGSAGSQDRGAEPTPRLATPATEPTDDSLERERDAVGDGPDVGGLTSSDDAQ